MEGIRESSDDDLTEIEQSGEELDEDEAKKIGACMMRMAEIAKAAIENQSISASDFMDYRTASGEVPCSEGNDDTNNAIGRIFIETAKREGTWSEALSALFEAGDLGGEDLVEFLGEGMPLELALSDEYIDILADGISFCDTPIPDGLLGRIHQQMRVMDGGEERFREMFVSGHKIDRTMAMSIYDSLDSDEAMSPERRADLELFREMGGNVLVATLNSYNLIYSRGSEDLVLHPRRDRSRYNEAQRQDGRRILDYLKEESLVDAADASGLFEDSFRRFGTESTSSNRAKSAALEEIVKSNYALTSDDEDVSYWMKVCKEKGENVFEKFDFVMLGDGRIIDEFDFSDKRVSRLFAISLGRDDAFSVGNPSMYGKIARRGLLDDAFFREELARVVADRVRRFEADRSYLRSMHGGTPAAIQVLALKKGLFEEMNAEGLFDKYPECQEDRIIALVRRGDFTEKSRLGLLNYMFKSDDYYDESGELNDNFFDSCLKDINGCGEILDDVGQRRCCDYCLARGKLRALANVGEVIWKRESVKGAVRGFLGKYKELRLDESFLGGEEVDLEKISQFFDESGPKQAFWAECIEGEQYGFLGLQSADLLSGLGFDEDSAKILRGMGNYALGDDGEVTADNVLSALTRFIHMDADDWVGASIDDLKIKDAFSESNIAIKDEAMRQLRQFYEEYLKSGNDGEFPKCLKLLSEYMRKNDGAGPLTQIEAFLDYCGALGRVGENGLKDGIKAVEGQIKDWDNISKANFYSTSAEIIKVGPEFYKEFLTVFCGLEDEQDFKTFAQEVFPLYQAKLALLKNYEDHSDGIGDGYSEATYSGVDKKQLLNDLHNMLLPFTLRDGDEGVSQVRRNDAIEIVKKKIFNEISVLFTEKFNILPEVTEKINISPKVISRGEGEEDANPVKVEALGKETMRTVENAVLYLSNMAYVDVGKKNLVGFYLALMLTKRENGTTAWDSFRRGEKCDPYAYLTPEAAREVKSRIEGSESASILTSENTKISSPERLAEFSGSLQDEVSEIRIGNTMSIDARLQNLKGNIEELADPDLYGDQMSKSKVAIISRHSPKIIGEVATALWKQEAKGLDPAFDEESEEAALAKDLIKLLTDANIEVTPTNIQKYLQQGFKELAPVGKTFALIRERDVANKVARVQDMLVPEGEVAEIFGELGEEFRPESGVLVLSEDLGYLQSIITKAEERGTLGGDEEERMRKISLVRDYVGEIERRKAELDEIYEEIVKRFESIRIPGGDRNETGAIIEKLEEIKKIISTGSGRNSAIISTCLCDLNEIIENMRACLSCKTKGINNDTNLTFGEPYKFYIKSQTKAGERGSIADEVVFFVPTSNGGETRMSFVMDMIYGTRNKDILMGHVGVLAKKAKALKAKYPEVPISVFVTSSGASSCSVSIQSESLLAQLRGLDGVTVEGGTREVNIPKSGLGDHYIEIGGVDGNRRSGVRLVEGIEIIFN